MATPSLQIKWALAALILPMIGGFLVIMKQREKTQAKMLNYRPESVMMAHEKDPQFLLRGQAVFQMRCAVCHGEKGEGKLGANLADEYWLHGNGGSLSILHILRDGIINRGMPAWKEVIEPEDLLKTAFYVRSLQGTQPPNAKAPQGQLIKNEMHAK